MTTTGRITMLKRDAESKVGRELLNLMLDMCHDGELTIEEVEKLHIFLRKSGDPFPAIQYLRAITREIVADGSVDEFEAYRLKMAMARVAPLEVRRVILTHLESIGAPNPLEDENAPWTRDEATNKQIDLILKLGGKVYPRMTKGEASRMIDDYLERRPPTPRQKKVLRFFDRMDLLDSTKEAVSVWIDDLFRANERYERAWDRFKYETGDDPRDLHPETVPIGAFKKYLRQ